MYESPISLFTMTPDTILEDEIYKEILKYKIVVDKDELSRALRYDRNQYAKGYNDALMEKMSFWIVSLDSCEFICNHCLKNSKTATDYCPNCGAKMKGDVVGAQEIIKLEGDIYDKQR